MCYKKNAFGSSICWTHSAKTLCKLILSLNVLLMFQSTLKSHSNDWFLKVLYFIQVLTTSAFFVLFQQFWFQTIQLFLDIYTLTSAFSNLLAFTYFASFQYIYGPLYTLHFASLGVFTILLTWLDSACCSLSCGWYASAIQSILLLNSATFKYSSIVQILF